MFILIPTLNATLCICFHCSGNTDFCLSQLCRNLSDCTFVAVAVRSHFDDCPDSHRHFCFHGTCRFLILEETPACVCHAGFVGMRCEHADLLAVVATNHRQQTVATVLVLCVIGCVLIMVCWWRQDCRRRNRAHHYIPEKHGASCHPSESGTIFMIYTLRYWLRANLTIKI
uniref:Transforming growth factor, alpha n=1 Tax=Cyclopterus lumpus TaxID=8103 RepID=A0A8C2ZP79_CYCLU